MTDTSDLPGTVRLRVAPSPTGDPHVGTAYMSLFNLAFVRQQGGRFVLRIEDTDRARFREDSEKQVFDTLRWLGLTWDEGPDVGGPCAPYRQSERLDTYTPYVERLLADGKAYHCWCSTERLAQMREAQQKAKLPTGYDRLCVGKTEEERSALPGFSPTPVVRMLIPDDAPLEFDDLIRGRVSAPRPDDQVILKADGFPTYHLAVVVDDHEMGITHVVRGEEWISSTPKHVLLYQWLGLTPPAFAHMPLLRNTDKSKISKRKNPAARLTWFQEQGYLPEALVNFLALLAYPPAEGAEGEDVEVFGFEEFSQRFAWADVNPVGPIFDLKKLDWLNGVHIRGLDVDDLASRLLPFLQADGVLGDNPSLGELARLRAVTALIQTRMAHLTEADRPGRPVLRRRRRRRGGRRRPRPAQGRRRRRAGRRRGGPRGRARRALRGARQRRLVHRRGRRGGPARGARRRAGHQAEVRLRAAAHRRLRAPGVAAAVRVDGDPGQGGDADPAAGAARDAAEPAAPASRDLGAGEAAR